MKMKWQTIIPTILILGAIGLGTLLSGCAPKAAVKDPFFEKWRELSQTSRGYSPASPSATPAIAQPGAPLTVSDLPAGTITGDAGVSGPLLPDQLITLKMHDVDVAVLLRALARAANQNIVINEKVQGRASLFIQEAPWDRVFQGILRTHGLTFAWEGDIIRILTVEDMEIDLKRETQKQDLRLVEPLVTKVIPVHYTEALKLKDNMLQLLTRNNDDKQLGTVMVDEHSNALIVQAIRTDLNRMIPLIEMLDRPTPQILIEAHIVEATKDTARVLGIQWGGLMHENNVWITPGAFSTGALENALSAGGIDPTSSTAANFFDPTTFTDALGFSLGFAVENIGKSILTAQLSALAREGKVNILSSPSITTLDNQVAKIESGDEVPFQTISDGEISIVYKKAVLSLEVTPHVIEGKTLKMKIVTNKDELDFSRTVSGNPTIVTKKAETNVILFDGQTTVIGGLNKENMNSTETGIPGLKDIPVLGNLFKGKSSTGELEDVLIFITPHILKQKTLEPEKALSQSQPAAPQSGGSQAQAPLAVVPLVPPTPQTGQDSKSLIATDPLPVLDQFPDTTIAPPLPEALVAEDTPAAAAPAALTETPLPDGKPEADADEAMAWGTALPPEQALPDFVSEPLQAVTPAEKTTATQQPLVEGRYALQVGAFLEKRYALERMALLQARGYAPYLFSANDYRQRRWHTVRIGRYGSLAAAAGALRGFKRERLFPAVITYSDSLEALTNTPRANRQHGPARPEVYGRS